MKKSEFFRLLLLSAITLWIIVTFTSKVIYTTGNYSQFILIITALFPPLLFFAVMQNEAMKKEPKLSKMANATIFVAVLIIFYSLITNVNGTVFLLFLSFVLPFIIFRDAQETKKLLIIIKNVSIISYFVFITTVLICRNQRTYLLVFIASTIGAVLGIIFPIVIRKYIQLKKRKENSREIEKAGDAKFMMGL
jgi:hypothetical protein